jgi:hypothetical protein
LRLIQHVGELSQLASKVAEILEDAVVERGDLATITFYLERCDATVLSTRAVLDEFRQKLVSLEHAKLTRDVPPERRD